MLAEPGSGSQATHEVAQVRTLIPAHAVGIDILLAQTPHHLGLVIGVGLGPRGGSGASGGLALGVAWGRVTREREGVCDLELRVDIHSEELTGHDLGVAAGSMLADLEDDEGVNADGLEGRLGAAARG